MAIEDIARQLGNGLGETLAVHPSDAPHVRYATVAAVNTDGTLDVTVDGTTLRGVCATTGCVGAAAGMRCVVLRQGPLATVVGLVANTNLADVYLQNAHVIWGRDTDGNVREVLQVTNGNNNVVLGWGGWGASQGHTKVYGNEINLTSNGKIDLNGNISDGWHYATAASIVTGNFVRYMTFGNIAVVQVQEIMFGTTAPASNNATICSGLPHADGSNFIFPLKTAQAETGSLRVKITAAGLMQTHWASATTASTSRHWCGLAVYPYTR